MTTDTLANGLKAVFGANEATTTGTYFQYLPTLKSDKTPGGYISPENLVSVLGVPGIKDSSVEKDFNNYRTPGMYSGAPEYGHTNTPASGGYFVVFVISTRNNFMAQLAWEVTQNRLYSRTATSPTATWSSWKRFQEMT